MTRAGDIPVDAGRLDPARITALLDSRDAALREWDKGADAGARGGAGAPVLLVTIGQEPFAIRQADVVAALAPPRVARLPGSPPGHRGAFSHNGAIWNLFDPADALKVPAGDPSAAVLLLAGPEPRIAIAVASAPAIDRLDGEEAPAGTVAALAPMRDGGHARLVDAGALRARLLGHRPNTIEGEEAP